MDHHATTPVDPRVLGAMMPYFTEKFGNASSRDHRFGRQAQKAVEKARGEVACLVGADSREVVFTSGATESNNLAVKGVAEAYRQKGNHVITVSTEHKAVLDSCKRLELQGLEVTVLPVKSDGRVDAGELKKAIREKTILISVMLANNEIGTIQPVTEIGKIARERGILFHCDAAQAAGKIPINMGLMRIDLLSLSAHKIYGPKGVGALVVRKTEPRVRLVPILDGGGHETGFRSGTLNVPGIVGFGRASAIGRAEMKRESRKLAGLRDRLQKGVLRISGTQVNGGQACRLPNNLNVSFEGVPSEALIRALGGVAVSSGSACISAGAEPSYVLKAIGVPEALRRCSLRFGLGRFNTQKEIDEVIARIVKAVNRLRS